VNVWDYFDQWQRQCEANSLPSDSSYNDMCAAFAGSDENMGRIFGRLVISERAYLSVSERVVIGDGRAYREEYSYYLIVDDEEVFGRDRDLTHVPPEHGHEGEGHEWIETGPVSFQEVIDLAWERVTELDAF